MSTWLCSFCCLVTMLVVRIVAKLLAPCSDTNDMAADTLLLIPVREDGKIKTIFLGGVGINNK